MSKPTVATIINFCTNEARFLKACIEQCRFFSDQIIIALSDHFHDGSLENRSLLETIYAAFPDCLFVEYPFAEKRIPKRVFRTISRDHFWHSVSRAIGAQFIKPEIEWVLFLDADEIPEGENVLGFLKEKLSCNVYKFANYWYFREPSFRAEQWEDSIVFAKSSELSLSVLLKDEERNAIFDLLPGPKRRKTLGENGWPMFHHFSWVRTKEEMLGKVRKWGHRSERNWEALVEKEFAEPFSGKDFLHGYRYQTLPPRFDLSMGQIQFQRAKSPMSVCRLSEEDLLDCLRLRPFWRWKRAASSHMPPNPLEEKQRC